MNINVTKITNFIQSTTGKLTLTYLSLIMLMSLGFSIVIYNVSDHQLHRQAPVPESIDESLTPYYQVDIGPRKVIRDFLKGRADEARDELIWNLFALNVSVALIGAGVSYYLARRTLQPIEAAMNSKDQFISDASH